MQVTKPDFLAALVRACSHVLDFEQVLRLTFAQAEGEVVSVFVLRGEGEYRRIIGSRVFVYRGNRGVTKRAGEVR